MTFRRLITLPLAMLIIAGLAFAPLVTSASAKALGMMPGVHGMSHANAGPDMQSMADMDSMQAMDSHDVQSVPGMEPMAADMPCCPDEQNSKDCQDCPLMAICALKTAQAHPSMDGALPMRSPVRTIQSAHDDALVSGLDHPPPDHPPRHLI